MEEDMNLLVKVSAVSKRQGVHLNRARDARTEPDSFCGSECIRP